MVKKLADKKTKQRSAETVGELIDVLKNFNPKHKFDIDGFNIQVVNRLGRVVVEIHQFNL